MSLFFVSCMCMLELKFAIYHRAAKRLSSQASSVDVCSMGCNGGISTSPLSRAMVAYLLQLHQGGWVSAHESLSARPRSQQCSKNLCGPFLRAILPMTVEASNGSQQEDKHTHNSTNKVRFQHKSHMRVSL